MKVKLTEICQPKQWNTLPKSKLEKRGYPVYGANGIIGYYNEYNHEYPTILITCRGATCGTVNISKEKAYINGNAMCLDKLSNKVLLKYLYYYLKFYNFKNVISGSAQPQITIENLQKLYVKITDITKQQKIVDSLEKIDKIITIRKKQLEKMDLFVKSLFIELFGSQVDNPYDFEKGIIKDVVNEVKYGTSSPANDNGIYPYLRMGNITYDGQLDLTNLKYITIDDKELDKYIVKKGDVLFNRTNSKELVGKTCVFNLDEPMIIAGYIIRVRTNNRVIPEYLSAVLNSKYGKQTLFDMCKSIVGQANINAQELQKIKLLIPPIEIQLKYKSYLVQIDKSKLAIQQSLEQLETLKKSLMQEYFC